MSNEGSIPLTRVGHDRLKNDLKRMKEERPLVSKAIEEARAHGDLSENAEYHAAREKLGMLQAQIIRLEDVIGRAQVIDPGMFSDTRIRFGATVTLYDEDNDEEVGYQIVGEPEADIEKNLLSVLSPLGRALISKEEGDDLEFRAPGGLRHFSIISVEYI
ncbi:MAG: transcription elongation factor GreA [Deltaproteobacteria bacterium]|nr:transcription elongation factor GreA [Deltaproteobacteria bacterium]